ncbi:PL29 family lyase N-terminal domain-containing protein [Niabella sp. CJ426]|uniref:PL29 family lyase N-terminal domain-containing protein n=1 Tax=Niabella sp. CJ426 TaxID=3393740 RepID=UPI003CFD0650
MKSKTLLTLLVLLVLSACQKKDIDALRNEVNDLKSRVTRLEDAAKTLNTDIASLKTIATALQAKISVVSYTATATGYELTMSDGSKINLNNGKDGINGTNGTNGKDGINAPVIGLKQDADGNYYWTIGGDWLLQNGQKIKANGTNGTNGANGTTPLLMVNATSNQWMVSYDSGNTWSVIKDANGNPIAATGATGQQGQPGQTGPQGPAGPAGVPGFSITETDTAIVITYGGSTYTLPKGGSAETGLPRIILATSKALGDKVRISVNAELADRSRVWIDLNNNEQQDAGEKINTFGSYAEYTLTTSKTLSFYGKITKLNCTNNLIVALDVSKNTALTSLDCNDNQLTALDVSKNTLLNTLNCYENKINSAEMVNLINSLPLSTTGGFAMILVSSAGEGNATPTSASISAANAKNWSLYKGFTELTP